MADREERTEAMAVERTDHTTRGSITEDTLFSYMPNMFSHLMNNTGGCT